MAVESYRVSVTASPTLIARGGRKGDTLIIKNAHATAACSLGGALVTYAGGFSMLAGDVDQVPLSPGEELYGVADAGVTVICHVIQKAGA